MCVCVCMCVTCMSCLHHGLLDAEQISKDGNEQGDARAGSTHVQGLECEAVIESAETLGIDDTLGDGVHLAEVERVGELVGSRGSKVLDGLLLNVGSDDIEGSVDSSTSHTSEETSLVKK